MNRIDRWCEVIVTTAALLYGVQSWIAPMGKKLICYIIVWYPGCW